MSAGVVGGSGDAHHLGKLSDATAVFMEVGDRSPDDAATYPDDSLAIALIGGR